MTARFACALVAIVLAIMPTGQAGAQSYPDYPSRSGVYSAAPYPAYPADPYASQPYRAAPPTGRRYGAAPPADYDDEDYDAPPEGPRFEAPPSDWRYDTARPAPGIERHDLRPPAEINRNSGPDVASLPQDVRPETGEPAELPPQFRRQLVEYHTKEAAGTIIIDTPNTYLYLVLGNGKALRYGIGVGREGFTWSGRERISRMAEWPDWYPPKDMIDRQPYLPRFMAGGPGNPLGARALYLGHTLYRIHGTNQPSTIGKFVSSGCIRLLNADIEDLYRRVNVGTRVVVLPGKQPKTAAKGR
jgi:lipoprotein-anchoring transpeptidase ErfK/SrfK